MPTPSPTEITAADTLQRGRIWDAPVRVFHWLFVACFAIAWLTRETPAVDIHAAAGYAMFGLISFRFFWGFIGSRPARFSSFAYSPQAAIGYLRGAIAGTAPEYLSHNPAESWSSYLSLGSGLSVTLSGALLLAAKYGLGPFAGNVEATAAPTLHSLHEFIAWAMAALSVAHLTGVAHGSYSHRQNLVGAMISGDKNGLPLGFPRVPRHLAVALGLAATILGGSYAYLHNTGWTESYTGLRQEAKASATKPTLWTEQCGSCHLAFPVQFLPARSWQRMLLEQDKHFGDDLGLSADKLAALRDFTRLGVAEPQWAGMMFQASIAADASTQRITETDFWLHRHRRIAKERFNSDKVAGKHDCEACHADAWSGIFLPRLIQIPEVGPKF